MWPKMVGQFNVRGSRLVQGVVGFVFVFYDSEEFIVQDIEYKYKFKIRWLNHIKGARSKIKE